MRLESIVAHPGLNPAYFGEMERRVSAQNHNRAAREFNQAARAMGLDRMMPMVAVPKQPNRYVPHTGTKEAARHAGKGNLGPNASRELC